MNKLNYMIPLKLVESTEESNDFFIEGVAINATTTDNNHKFLAEELKSAAGSLTDRPLLTDHDDTLRSIAGRVIMSDFDSMNERIIFKAKLNDTEQGRLAKQLIKSGDLNTVSVGANVESFEEEDGTMVPRGIKFKELSLVASPADDAALFTLTQSLNKLKESEATQTITSSDSISHSNEEKGTDIVITSKLDTNKLKGRKIMEEDEKTTESEEAKPESDKSEEKTEEMNEISNLKSSMNNLMKKFEAQSNLLSEALAKLNEVKEADADEVPEESTEPEAKPEPEAKAEEPAEEEEEAEEESEKVGESDYKIVQGYKSFTVEKSNYK